MSKFFLLFMTIFLLLGCARNDKLWDRYAEMNSGTSSRSSKMHSKLSELHHKKTDQFKYNAYNASVETK